MQQPSNSGGGTTSELSSDAKEIGSKAANRLYSEADSRKGAAVSQAQSISSAIGKTADSLEDSAPDWLKSALQQGSQKIQQFADMIEQKDSREILDDVQRFARDRPALFLGTCAAAGFAAARIFKAGGEQSSSKQFGESASYARSQSAGEQFDPSQPRDNAKQSFDSARGDSLQSKSDPLVGSSTGSSSRGEFV